MRTRLPQAIIAALAVAALTLVGATPASASSWTGSCPNYTAGLVTTAVSSARASLSADPLCGGVQVRVKYNLNIGVTAYTAWKSGATYAVAYPPAGSGLISADFKIGTTYVYNIKP